MNATINSIILFLLSFLLMTLWVRIGTETEWATAFCVAGSSSLVAILLPVKRYRIRR